jgi:hypothetical protein
MLVVAKQQKRCVPTDVLINFCVKVVKTKTAAKFLCVKNVRMQEIPIAGFGICLFPGPVVIGILQQRSWIINCRIYGQRQDSYSFTEELAQGLPKPFKGFACSRTTTSTNGEHRIDNHRIADDQILSEKITPTELIGHLHIRKKIRSFGSLAIGIPDGISHQ